MPKFRKKPIVIEARQHYHMDSVSLSFEAWEENGHAIIDWINQGCRELGRGRSAAWEDSQIAIETLEGRMYANPGDYIIKGIKGEFYPCKPDIFEATYEPAE